MSRPITYPPERAAVFQGSPEEDRVLLARVVLGGRKAQRDLCRRLSVVVNAVARGKISRLSIPTEDLVQGALLHLVKNNWEILQRWPGEGSLMSWAARAARNHMLDQIRRDRRHALPLVHFPDPDHTPEGRVEPDQETILEVAEARNCVKAAKEQLSDPERRIISLNAAGKKHREIAEALSTTIGSVGTMLGRAKEKLKRFIVLRCRDHLPTLLSQPEAFETV